MDRHRPGDSRKLEAMAGSFCRLPIRCGRTHPVHSPNAWRALEQYSFDPACDVAVRPCNRGHDRAYKWKAGTFPRRTRSPRGSVPPRTALTRRISRALTCFASRRNPSPALVVDTPTCLQNPRSVNRSRHPIFSGYRSDSDQTAATECASTQETRSSVSECFEERRRSSG